MAKQSIKAVVRDAVRQDTKLRKSMLPDGSATSAVSTADSFVNFAHKLGIGADNPLSTSSYGFNPITRQRTLLEWTHRGSWIAGVVVDCVADDMTREGVDYTTEMSPEDSESLDHCITSLGVWTSVNEVVRWGRLYGGCIGVLLIDGQDFRTPFNVETVGKGAFRGVLALDRWMLEPTVDDLVTEMGPSLGMPKYYRVQSNAPALRGLAVHYSRVVFRHDGVKLPYQQRLTENLWGISVLERLWDRMIAFDSASTGAAQLIFKAYLRTMKVKGLREVVSSSEAAMNGLVKQMELMRRYQGIEGISLVDAEDEFEAQAHGAFSGISDTLTQFAMQLSGASQIPLTRLFGQSPGGLNATGDNDMRNYYDGIKQKQMQDLHYGVTIVHKAAAASEGIKLPDNFAVDFTSLWQLTATDKATIAKTNTETVLSAKEAGLTSARTSLEELRQSSRQTGVWTNITAELIESADEEITPPMGEGAFDPETGEPLMPPGPGSEKKGPNESTQVRPKAAQGAVGKSQARRVAVPPKPARGG